MISILRALGLNAIIRICVLKLKHQKKLNLYCVFQCKTLSIQRVDTFIDYFPFDDVNDEFFL